MKRNLVLLLSLCYYLQSYAQLTPFEQSKDKNYTATYTEVTSYYKNLAKQQPQMRLFNYGSTDIGKPLTLVVLSKDKVFDPAQIKKQNKRVLLINNGIHPGEPEGIDASMMLVRDLLKKNQLPKDVVLCFIALYNIDGNMNRGQSRANQNGPRAYGFRGNYRNLDLNRDFIKADSKNALAFTQILNTWQPEVLLDNHTSDGADYQYVMTLIETQKDKQNPVLAAYTDKTLTPDLYKGMKKSGYEMIPYGAGEEGLPDSGIVSFMETPRFSTGFAAQHNIISYMTETHMLKPFDKRVWAAYAFMQNLISICQRDARLLGTMKKQVDADVSKQKTFALNWALDETKVDTITFKGYAAGYKTSDVSGLKRLFYDREKPYSKPIKFYNTYKASATADKPVAYIIPQAWGKVIDLFKLNKVAMSRLAHDTTLSLQMYYIGDYKTGTRPYEGHYIHSNVKLSPVDAKVKFYEGDYVVYVNQPINRYIVETLEPQGVDSFFAWNFFDSVLGQKEYYSDYVFEDIAAQLLKNDPDLRKKLDDAKTADPKLAASAGGQLNWVYRNSPYFEKTYLRYPVGRLLTNTKLDLQ
ncbi:MULTISPECIES: M14 family zinc carboxypeptidase [unclassified Mucilaginibacter]|uniref:M14 family zinc carboxypeptidase n=1 Tax=unclassified Mucilaginibacter TaxID=2617802 RepID=UPI002AC98648|nr:MULTISPECIES: M14 family zinc carboxypeptidase [unclassified Mucilaginibacter]MEB0248723.1 M14 family zinc carboxypeptidase [Mucilaginibacter sp. 5B2]MEB0260851.1 M14 family zinc carboxypeptidase [Mucilaginibacter sp. 10I4]MEB0278441.1 M14 family zinc carboxypeptidase [Mucilaginibacter sp. 10B2]MEB0301864.1 M14 family zinc carboxypeptidase [Mucilaginibacter sp. 5C4]WPX24086.1 M14 family zinc carboxypeptidase [Mucilaginibacter sp. 5C4]